MTSLPDQSGTLSGIASLDERPRVRQKPGLVRIRFEGPDRHDRTWLVNRPVVGSNIKKSNRIRYRLWETLGMLDHDRRNSARPSSRITSSEGVRTTVVSKGVSCDPRPRFRTLIQTMAPTRASIGSAETKSTRRESLVTPCSRRNGTTARPMPIRASMRTKPVIMSGESPPLPARFITSWVT